MAISQVWSADEKREIIAEYEGAKHGTKGAVLFKFGVSDHQMRTWRAARDEGLLDAGMNVRHPKRTPKRENAEITRLRDEVAQLREELDRARQDVQDRQQAVDALGKATALLHELVTGRSAAEPSRPEPFSSPEWDSSPT